MRTTLEKLVKSTQLPEKCMCESAGRAIWHSVCDTIRGFSSTEMDGPVARLQMS
jgi:hypothetical protein